MKMSSLKHIDLSVNVQTFSDLCQSTRAAMDIKTKTTTDECPNPDTSRTVRHIMSHIHVKRLSYWYYTYCSDVLHLVAPHAPPGGSVLCIGNFWSSYLHICLSHLVGDAGSCFVITDSKEEYENHKRTVSQYDSMLIHVDKISYILSEPHTRYPKQQFDVVFIDGCLLSVPQHLIEVVKVGGCALAYVGLEHDRKWVFITKNKNRASQEITNKICSYPSSYMDRVLQRLGHCQQ